MPTFRRTLLALAMAASGYVNAADINEAKSFDIKAQPMDRALVDFSKQAGFQVVADSSGVEKLQTRGVSGSRKVSGALDELLAGSGLSYRVIEPNVIVVEKGGKPGASGGASQPGPIVLAQASSSDPNAAKDREIQRLEAITVTAQKRTELLTDVPVPVTVISVEKLVASNQLRLQDYYNKVPGLGLALIGDGSAPAIVIRGITTGGLTNPTVGIVVDDVPYGTSVTVASAPSAPDIDPGALARVEVLRGPQGTLYGASSIGGLLKFVTIDPSTDALRGTIQAGIVGVTGGATEGNIRGAINIPISDTLAVHASGFAVRDPGYVDNLQTGESDINRRDSKGGRVAALWRLPDGFALRLSAMIQESERQGTQDVDATLGELQQRMLRGTGIYGRHTQAYSATLTGNVGNVELTSITGYNVDKTDTSIDQSAAFGSLANTNFGVTGVAGPLRRNIEKFSQEVRGSIALSQRMRLLLGAFYTTEDVVSNLVYSAVNPSSNQVVGTLFTNDQPSKFDEYAGFANLTMDITERFDLQVGGRYSENKQSFSGLRSGPLAVAFNIPFVAPEVHSKDDSFTYLVAPRFRISPDAMVYGRLASGYRPGGPNGGCGTPGIPCQYAPDTTRNYEVGIKGGNRAFSFDASIYYIDWKNIQLPLVITGLSYTDNATRAKSQGAELAVEARPFAGLTLSGWVAWTDAVLKEDIPATVSNVSGRAGDRLPYTSRNSASLSVRQELAFSSIDSFLEGSVSYVGDRLGVFRARTATRETFPDYTQVDLRAGARYATWGLTAYVNNVTDERGILRSGLDALRPTYFTYIQPRTVGLFVSKDF